MILDQPVIIIRHTGKFTPPGETEAAKVVTRPKVLVVEVDEENNIHVVESR